MIQRCALTASLLFLVQPAPAQKPAFDVASIRLNTSGNAGGGAGPRAGGFFARNATLRGLIQYAYAPPKGSFLAAQIIGGPNWTQTDHFDIEAKTGTGGAVPIEQTKLMLQSLLEDRFQLKTHRETRDLPVYNLVLIKKGPKLSEDQTPPDPRQGFITFASDGQPPAPLPRGAMRMVTGAATTTISGTAISVSKIVMLLQGRSDRIIIDKTGFKGLVDVQLQFSQDLAAAPADVDGTAPNQSGPSLFAAIQDLGLKLETAKAPLEVLVIDSVQKPSGN